MNCFNSLQIRVVISAAFLLGMGACQGECVSNDSHGWSIDVEVTDTEAVDAGRDVSTADDTTVASPDSSQDADAIEDSATDSDVDGNAVCVPQSGATDPDGDGISGEADNCPCVSNPMQDDSDGDTVG